MELKVNTILHCQAEGQYKHIYILHSFNIFNQQVVKIHIDFLNFNIYIQKTLVNIYCSFHSLIFCLSSHSVSFVARY